ncbi:MAG TPA: hypothetical protein VMV29_11385 [Ktedonobacterales bacterium]|nr:hypothetical protein [Ktedonobacterales bacterium]
MNTHLSVCNCTSRVVRAVLFPGLCLTLATLLVACGASSAATTGATATAGATVTNTPTAGQAPNLCAALTTTQLQQITGVAFTPIVAHPMTGLPNVTQAANCAAIPTTGGTTTGAIVFGLQIFTTPALASAYYTQQRATSAQSGATITDLHGVGDQAFLFTNTPSAETVLFAVKGATFLMLSLDLVPPLASAQVDAEHLATAILAHF